MTVENHEIEVETKKGTDIVDITETVSGIVKNSKVKNGSVLVFVHGSTASVSTIEFEPNLVADFKAAMENIIPSNIPYRHKETWGDDNAHSHIRATIMGPSVTVPFENKKLKLGTWQQITLIDHDVPARKRKVMVQINGE